MQRLGFQPWVEQAVMVKHLAAGIRHPNFNPVRVKGAALPPTSYFMLINKQEELRKH